MNLLSGPAETSAILQALPRGAEVMVVGRRKDDNDRVWLQVTFERRTGWVLNSQVDQAEELKTKRQVRKSANFSGLDDRQKDKQRLFLKYDTERREREFQEVLGSDCKFILRPIQRVGISRF